MSEGSNADLIGHEFGDWRVVSTCTWDESYVRVQHVVTGAYSVRKAAQVRQAKALA